MSGRYSKEQIEEVIRRSPIRDVIGDYIQLRPSGRRFMAVCPFHGDKDPSLSVNPDKGLWYCFGCHEGGNVLGFLEKIEHIGFNEALEMAARKAGITLRSEQDRGSDERERIMHMIKELALFYYEQLVSAGSGRGALAYLRRRGVKPETINLFKMGYAPQARINALFYLEKKGFSREEILKSGMVMKRVDSSELFDYFRNRITIPILDTQGRYIAMGGRIFDDAGGGGPKYLNSPETSVFWKGRTLFGIHMAKKSISQEDMAIVVEGYMDQIMLVQGGIQNVVASMGTSLSMEQARLLKKFCSRCVLAYDADRAGQMATVKGVEIFEEAGITPRVLVMPQGEDPDSLIRSTSPAQFMEQIRNAADLIDFKIRMGLAAQDVRNPSGKAAFVRELIPVLQKIKDVIKRDEYIKRISEISGVREDLVRQTLSEAAQPLQPRQSAGLYGSPPVSAEEKLLKLILAYPEAHLRSRELLSPAEISDAGLRQIFEIVFIMEPGRQISAEDFIPYLDEEGITKKITELIMTGEAPPFSEEAVRELVKVIKDEKLKIRFKALEKEVQKLLSENNIDHSDERFVEYQRLSQYFKGSK